MPAPVVASPERPDIQFNDKAETALFYDLTRWQEALARSIARNNLALRSAEIATATNRIILALIFLRIAEDRGLVPAGTLEGFAGTGESHATIGSLLPYTASLYHDEVPSKNSVMGLDPFTGLIVDDRVVVSLLREICSPGRKYHFTTMAEDGVAQVFARYLARTVRRSATHQATIVDTHDTVLSRGTVIPPLPVLRYMAEHAIGAALGARSSGDPLPLRILDPACGSGGPLLAAYNQMLSLAGGQSTTPEERREILNQSIHGVDINPHAVAVTRMLLFYGSCHDSSKKNTALDFLALAEGIFRMLRHTILCGNALIGPEITGDESWTFCPARDRHFLNLFAWNDHFPEIHAAGGFDAVIGNPPGGAVENREWIQQYFQRHYATYHLEAERSAYFVEKGCTLVRTGGTLSFVMSTRWLRGDGGSPLRAFLKTRQIGEITDLPGTGLCILRLRNTKPAEPFMVVRAGPATLREDPGRIAVQECFPVNQSLLDDGGWSLADTRAEGVISKMERSGTLFEQFCMGEIGCGSLKRFDERLLLEAAERDLLVKRDRRSTSLIRPYIRGNEIGRYYSESNRRHLLSIMEGWLEEKAQGKSRGRWLRERYPAVARHLRAVAPGPLEPAEGDVAWYEITCRDVFRTKDQPKILFPCKCLVPVFTYDTGRSIIDRDTGYLVSANLYLLGVLNSRLIRFWVMYRQQQKKTHTLLVTADVLAGLYIHTPDFDDAEESGRCARIESLVKKIIVYHEQLAREPDEKNRELFRKKIERTDRQIDSLVFDLYGLTLEEAGFVELAVTAPS
jgi:hypothetical protein